MTTITCQYCGEGTMRLERATEGLWRCDYRPCGRWAIESDFAEWEPS